MRVKTTLGEVIQIPIGGAIAGYGLTEITFTSKDVMGMQQPEFAEWLADLALCRLLPEENSKCTCIGFYQPVNCPEHGSQRR